MTIGPYELNDIYCGDSAVMLKALPDASIDLTVTSPPYDNLRAYNGFFWNFTLIAVELYRVTKPGGVVVWVVGDATVNGSETGSSFRQALGFVDLGFNMETMIYKVKGTGAKGNDKYYWQSFEYMLVFSKGTPKTINLIMDKKNITAGGNSRGRHTREYANGSVNPTNVKTPEYGRRDNVWEYQPGNDETGDHPAPFPEALARDHIISWSNPGDIVLDPFAGSGTTAKMSKVLSRHWLGFDISQGYVDLARRRVAGANVPLPLFVEQPQPKPTQDTLL